MFSLLFLGGRRSHRKEERGQPDAGGGVNGEGRNSVRVCSTPHDSFCEDASAHDVVSRRRIRFFNAGKDSSSAGCEGGGGNGGV